MAFHEISDPFRRLVRIMERLQEPGGCPWDREQTHESLKPYMIEEAYEALDAIDRESYGDLKEELGDVLLQVVFHSVLARRFDRFEIDEVIDSASEKMVRRHPHVFAEVEAATSVEVTDNWDQLKAQERAAKAASTEAPPSVLTNVPRHLPALLKAQRMQEKAGRVGFEWETMEQVLAKVEEEVAELREALAEQDSVHAAEELGDLIFALANVARHLNVDAEETVRQTCEKFRTRFAAVEACAHRQERDLKKMPLAEMMAAWDEAKLACKDDSQEKGS